MKVLLCGAWDGCSVWLQWDDVNPDSGYRLRIRFRNVGGTWEEWRSIHGLHPYRRAWTVIPVWRDGAEMQAQVAAATAEATPEEAWVMAEEVTFARSRARFRISTARRYVRYGAGDSFHCIVDGGECSYRIKEDLELQPGESAEVDMEAVSLTGYCQLDRPGHFRYSPALGLVIENLEPSVDDTVGTGRDFSLIKAVPRMEPLRLIFGGGASNPFNGNA